MDGEIYLLKENALKTKLNYKTHFSIIHKLKNSFKDRLYIDLFRDQSNNMKNREDYLLDLSNKFDIPLCCTNDVSFLDPSIYDAHDCLNCISQNTTVENPNRKKPNKEAYFKSSDTMRKTFSDLPEAVTNTINIAKRCSFILEDQAPKLPNINSGIKNSEITALKEQAYSGLLKT